MQQAHSHPRPVCPAPHPNLTLSQVIDDNARLEAGEAPANTALRTADAIFVRTGVLDHFDLRVNADSDTGRAIADAFDAKPLPNAQRTAKIIEALQLEIAAHSRQTVGKDHELALKLHAE